MNAQEMIVSCIILIPLLGCVLNAFLGKRMGKGFVKFVGVGAPLVAFVLSLSIFFGFFSADYGHPVNRVVAFKGDRAAISRIEAGLLTPSMGSDRDGWGFRTEDDGRVLRITGAQDGINNFTLKNTSLNYSNVEFGYATDLATPRSYVFPTPTREDPNSQRLSWISFGNLNISFKLRVDRLAIVLLLIITGVGSLIHLYSVGYMGDRGAGTFARFFTYLNLFIGAMLILVMGDNILMMFIGWEGVGLCSYLLIGFDYDDKANAACGSKAFIVNRIGDVGFVLGTLALLVAVSKAFPGDMITLDFEQLNELGKVVPEGTVPAATLGIACVLLFLGATGKSAQIPLHLWLPDAMAGPTPVSALIHAATMVTAGIYMICRLNVVFLHAEFMGIPVLGIVAIVGVLTAFFAGCAAMGQDDIKRVLAYSTISQLGYMFVAVGAAAFGGAIFHLVTHAFFKALLFLGAGAVIHATHTQSMREMGGLRKSMPVTYWTMLVGALALAGFPLMSGFFSKDMVLYEALVRYNSANSSLLWGAVYGLGVITGLITAVYSTRMICMTFFGEYRGTGQPHEAPSSMRVPLVVLAVLAVLGGLLGLPSVLGAAGELLPELYLGKMFSGVQAAGFYENLPQDKHALHVLEWKGLGIGSLAALAGVFLGVYGWGRRRPSEIRWETAREGSLAALRRTLAAAWYYDTVVNKKVVQPAVKYMSELLWRNVDDAAIDRGLVDGFGRVAIQLSLFARVFQNGRVSRYAGYIVFGVIVLTVLVVLSSYPPEWLQWLLGKQS